MVFLAFVLNEFVRGSLVIELEERGSHETYLDGPAKCGGAVHLSCMAKTMRRGSNFQYYFFLDLWQAEWLFILFDCVRVCRKPYCISLYMAEARKLEFKAIIAMDSRGRDWETMRRGSDLQYCFFFWRGTGKSKYSFPMKFLRCL